MSIFGSRQEKPDYLSKTHPLMIEAWAKQGLVMDLKTGEPVLLGALTRRQQTDMFCDYDEYRDEKGTTIPKTKRDAINIVCVAVDKNRDWQLETPPPTAPEPTPWPEKLAAMKEDATRFLDRLQWEWRRSIRNDRLLRPIELNDLLRLRDTLAAVAAQAGDQHAALKRLVNGTPTVGTLNTFARSGHHPEM